MEEPIPADDVDATLRVRNATRVPIAAGENIYSHYGYRPFLEKEAVSIYPARCLEAMKERLDPEFPPL